jgi:hypothetical protein
MRDGMHAQNAQGTAKWSQCNSSSKPTTSLVHAQLLPVTASSVNIHYYMCAASTHMMAIPEVMSKVIQNQVTPCQSNLCIIYIFIQNPHPE